MKSILLLFALFCCFTIQAQSVTRDIKSFGAKGDGRTNDQAAFEAAATFFNARGGNGKLTIPQGTYIVGRQVRNGGPGKSTNAYAPTDVMNLTACKNLTIAGTGKAIIKYAPGLRFGAYDAATGEALQHPKGYYVNPLNAAIIGRTFYIYNCNGVTVSGLELDGNNTHIQLGGSYGDVGVQLTHFGVFIQNSSNITIQNLNVHHFGEDGIYITNKPSPGNDNIKVLNTTCNYNSRQGLSWAGGNSLLVKNCTFSNTGQVAFMSNPGAGVDIEAEGGPIANGNFQHCTFAGNKGQGLVADSGPSKDCHFTDCTFWATDSWSIWVTKPGFTFTNCTIHGSIVHGFDATTDAEATKYIGCHFEDLPYNGKTAYGQFLIECNNRRRESFTNCTFTSNTAKLMWISAPAAWKPEEKFQFTNCTFTIRNTNLPPKSWAAVTRGMVEKACTFTFTFPTAKANGYYLNSCCEPYNVDRGNNKVIYAGAR